MSEHNLPSLPVRPTATTLNVSDILSLAQRGRLRIPRFQTGLRWEARHVVELFDSIVRGFPIGGLLLWKRAADAETLHFGAREIAAPEIPDAYYIVDGQQRVTALVSALLHPDAHPLRDNYAVWVDLVDGRFQVHRERPPANWIPLNVLGERTKLQHWARSADFGDETAPMVDRAFQIEEAIVRYTMPAYVVEDASHEALRLIFSRTNSSGVPLKEEQVFEALFGDEAASKPLASLVGWLHEQTHFGLLLDSWVLRCVKSVGALDPRKSYSEKEPPPPELLAKTRDGLRRAIQFLREEAGFIHEKLLPYRFPLIVLARFFALHPEPHPRSRQLLVRWLWRGALAGTHGDSSNAAVVQHQVDVGDNEHKSVQRLLTRVPSDPARPRADRDWFGQAATTRIFASAMLQRDPLDPKTELPWDRERLLRLLSDRELGKVFRRPFPSETGIAARVLLPAGYQINGLREASEEVLESLHIEGDAAIALRRGDAGAFVRHRAASLERMLERVVRLKSSPGDSDRAPIAVVAALGT